MFPEPVQGCRRDGQPSKGSSQLSRKQFAHFTTGRVLALLEVYPQWQLAAKCCGTRFDTASKRLLVSTCSGAKFPPSNRPRRLARPRTSPFHGGNTGSNPVGDAKSFSELQSLLPAVRLFRWLSVQRDRKSTRLN